jgi:predicted thioesterase
MGRSGPWPPLGHEVHAEAEVVKVLGKRIEFKVSAHDETEGSAAAPISAW